jgi:alpha-tubulin suppressor-like RCC1 family protein
MAWNLIQTSGIVNAINCTIKNSIAEGGATFNAFFQNGNIDNGGNSGWDFSWRTLYWVGEGGNWDDTGHWSLSSGGGGGEQIPTLYDNVIFDSNSITLEDQSVLFPIDETSNLYSLNMTNLQHHITLGSQGFGSPVKQISCEYHTLILLENGDLHGCGLNTMKQLNPSSDITTWFDLSTVLMSGVKQFACGEHHTMVLMENGDVHGWGENVKQVNPLSATSPWIDQTTVFLSGVKQIACGYQHTMVLMENGDVHGWGNNVYRQVNPSSSDSFWTDTSTVILSGVKEISCRNHQTMVLMENGDVRGWGYNYYKQINPAVQSERWTDSSTVFLSGASRIVCGHFHTAILMENGDVHGWGYNSSGQINPSSLSQYAGDTIILSGVKQIACGYYNTMVLMENGDVRGIGGNYYGQINPDYLADSWVDINTVILSGVQNISCGVNHTFFLMEDGKIHSCGHNVYRESNPSFSTSPWIDTTIEIVPRWQIYSTHEINTHNSTIINSNTAGIFYSLFENNNINGGHNTGWNFGARTLYWIGNSGNWDDADHWSLSSGGVGGAGGGGGNELYGHNTKEPTIQDTLIFDSNSITLEDQTVLFPSDVGSGLYSLIMTDLQHQITLNSKDHIDTIKQIACGYNHTMILRENGDVHGWGMNGHGGINPNVINSYYTDSSTIILSSVNQIACGSYYTIALMENGDVHGWGYNIYGQVNPTSDFDRWLDSSTVILSGVKQIACGSRHTMALMDNGDVHGWGYETRAVNPDSNTTPWLDTSTVFLSGVKQIACGTNHTMVLMENGDVHGWGGNHYGQVNPNSISDFWIDKNTIILSGVKQIGCGEHYTMALMENGDVHGWGGAYSRVNPDSATIPWVDSSTVFLSGVKQIACGFEHVMVLMENGDVHGWGYNVYREVNPDGSVVNKSTVILSGVAQIDCGTQYTMVLMENGDIRGWGRNQYREVSPSYADQPFTRSSSVINYIWDISSGDGEINAHKSTIKNSRPDGGSIYYALTEDENIDGGNNIRGYNGNSGWIFDPFIFTVNADIITLPLAYGVYNFIVDWGDGTSDHITSYEDPKITHQYDTTGLYDISIKGQFTAWNITDSSDIKLKIVDVKQWGCISFYFSSGRQFGYCSNLIISATDIPYLDIPTSLERTFEMCSSITDIPNIDQWNMSNVVNMAGMFFGAGLSTENYEKLLEGWSSQNVQPNVTFDAGSATYHAGYSAYKQILVDKGWVITDGGLI